MKGRSRMIVVAFTARSEEPMRASFWVIADGN
jgi:hypothetical protein